MLSLAHSTLSTPNLRHNRTCNFGGTPKPAVEGGLTYAWTGVRDGLRGVCRLSRSVSPARRVGYHGLFMSMCPPPIPNANLRRTLSVCTHTVALHHPAHSGWLGGKGRGATLQLVRSTVAAYYACMYLVLTGIVTRRIAPAQYMRCGRCFTHRPCWSGGPC